MNIKKILLILFLIIVVSGIIFLGLTVRKMVIINNLKNKLAQFINSNNYYVKTIVDQGDSIVITDFYCKDSSAILLLNSTIKSNREERKLINYFEGDKINTYIESAGNKVALLDSNATPSKVEILNSFQFENNVWKLFQTSTKLSIKNSKLDGKECYVINGGQQTEAYIEKETGLVIKAKNGFATDEYGNISDIIVEYYYEFENVTDDNIKEPNISEYIILENNN